MLTISDERRKANKMAAQKAIADKKKHTIQQREALDALFARACRAVELKTLYAVRRDKLTKVLTQRNYLTFIRVVDRLMESF